MKIHSPVPVFLALGKSLAFLLDGLSEDEEKCEQQPSPDYSWFLKLGVRVPFILLCPFNQNVNT
jgi:hypothetical protein